LAGGTPSLQFPYPDTGNDRLDLRKEGTAVCWILQILLNPWLRRSHRTVVIIRKRRAA